jgi:hypothetical protein
MANTPSAGVRVDPAVAEAARARIGQPDLPLSVLARVGLLVLSGLSIAEALAKAQARPGPKPKAEAVT